jgi:putative SOS response-associated peptidase YedK
MCSIYGIQTDAETLKKSLSIEVKENKSWDLYLQGYLKTDIAPVVIFENDKLIVKEMSWSLCPSWSTDYPFRFRCINGTRPKNLVS